TGGAVGLAARYPNDAGIGKDPRVIHADHFDAWETDTAKAPPGAWDAVRNSDNPRQRQTLAVAGRVAGGAKEMPGKKVPMAGPPPQRPQHRRAAEAPGQLP